MSDPRSWRQRLAAFAAALPLSARERRWQVISRLAAESGNDERSNDERSNDERSNDERRSAGRFIGDDQPPGVDHGDGSERPFTARSSLGRQHRAGVVVPPGCVGQRAIGSAPR